MFLGSRPQMRSFMHRMHLGKCAHCGKRGVPVESHTVLGGERVIIFADGGECVSDSRTWLFLTGNDGTWGMILWSDLNAL